MGWVLFSFHLQRSYSLVVSDEVRECYLVSIAPMRRRWRIQHGGYAWESRRKSEEEALCIRYVHLSGRLQSMCDIVLGVEIERALRDKVQ